MENYKIIGIALTGFFILTGIVVTIIGGTLVFEKSLYPNKSGYYTTREVSLNEGDSVAIIFSGFNDELLEINPLTVTSLKTTLTSTGYFVGVASTNEVKNYLSSVTYSKITDFDFKFDGTFGVIQSPDLVHVDSSSDLTANKPTDQTFWETSSQNSVTWEVKSGSYSIVIMKADGTTGIALKFTFGFAIPIFNSLESILFLLGLVSVVIGLAVGFTTYFRYYKKSILQTN
jgi:hypothetical protein